MTMNTTDYLYEELDYLTELSDGADEESMGKIDARKKEVLAEIREIERFCSRWG
jgi:hypothetical protein